MEKKNILPTAESIDYTDPQAVIAYQRRAAQLYDLAGGFLLTGSTPAEVAVPSGPMSAPAAPTATDTAASRLSKADCKALQRQIRKQGETWLRHTRLLIDTLMEQTDMTIIADLTDAYDIYARIVERTDGRIPTPTADYVRKIRLNLFDRWLKGNKTLTRQQIAALIGQEISRAPHLLSPRHLHFYFDTQALLQQPTPQPSFPKVQHRPTIYW